MSTDTSRAQGGSPIRNAAFDDIIGTLGCVVRSLQDPTQRFVLSASHVLNPGGFGRIGDAVEAKINGEWKKIAELVDWTSLRDRSGSVHRQDAAIARITAPELVDATVTGIGVPAGVAHWVFEGKRLQACGATSQQVVRSLVHSSEATAPVYYDDWASAGSYALPFEDLILYGLKQGAWEPAMQPGDSGALVLDERQLAVGLHIARTDDAYPVRTSVCTPIAGVLEALGVTLETASYATAAAASGAAAAAASSAPRSVLPQTDADTLSDRSRQEFGVSVMPQLQLHRLRGSARWQLTADGLVVDGRIDRTGGRLVTVPRVCREFGPAIEAAAKKFDVPIELIIATICTESGGDRDVPSRPESNNRMSVGVMQTLIGTAREALRDESINEEKLRDPAFSIWAGTAYIAQQRRITAYDPPLVACAYNAGGLHPDDGVDNRWGLRQYPIGTGAHADRFVQWFNDCFATFSGGLVVPANDTPSLWRLFWG